MNGLTLTTELVNAFAPEHGPTSCNDHDLMNGFVRGGYDTPRCMRCFLLRNLGENTDNLRVRLLFTSERREE